MYTIWISGTCASNVYQVFFPPASKKIGPGCEARVIHVHVYEGDGISVATYMHM